MELKIAVDGRWSMSIVVARKSEDCDGEETAERRIAVRM